MLLEPAKTNVNHQNKPTRHGYKNILRLFLYDDFTNKVECGGVSQ